MARKKEETRSRILNAALDAFEEKGYAASTMEEIAERAGVAKGTLYNYFDGKEALLSGLAEEFAQAVHGQLKRFAVEKSQPLRERILAVLGRGPAQSQDHRTDLPEVPAPRSRTAGTPFEIHRRRGNPRISPEVSLGACGAAHSGRRPHDDCRKYREGGFAGVSRSVSRLRA